MDTEALRKRRPIWKLVLSFLGILAGLLIIFLIWLARLSERRWRDMELRVQEMKAEYKARIAPRPVLRGVATPGNAWDDYLPASTKLQELGHARRPLAEFVSRGKNIDRNAVEALLSQHGALLDQLRKGAGRAEGQFPWDWEAMVKGALGPWTAEMLAHLAICQARFLREEGKNRSAAEHLLDVAQLGRDLGDNGPYVSLQVGFAIQSLAFDELRDLVAAKALLVDDALVVAQGVEILDRTFPRLGATFLCEGLYFGSSCLSNPDAGWAGMPRLLTTHAFFEYDRRMCQAAESEGKAWSAPHKVAARLEEEASASWNPLIKISAPTFLTLSIQSAHERHAQLRLLRLAAEYRATGQIPELDDPFGTKLRHATVGDKLRFWSVGPNGVDNGGKKNLDIFLEIER